MAFVSHMSQVEKPEGYKQEGNDQVCELLLTFIDVREAVMCFTNSVCVLVVTCLDPFGIAQKAIFAHIPFLCLQNSTSVPSFYLLAQLRHLVLVGFSRGALPSIWAVKKVMVLLVCPFVSNHFG